MSLQSLTATLSAILYILLKGKAGEAYNVANEGTYITIREMAEFLCAEFNPKCKVVLDLHNDMGYAPVTKLNLSTDKLRRLGWGTSYSLKEMFERLIRSIQYARCHYGHCDYLDYAFPFWHTGT